MTMAKMYQSKEVTVVRSATPADKGFDKAKGDQSLIRLADGTEKVVPTAEISDRMEKPPQ